MRSTPWVFGLGVFWGVLFTSFLVQFASRSNPSQEMAPARAMPPAVKNARPLPEVKTIDYQSLAQVPVLNAVATNATEILYDPFSGEPFDPLPMETVQPVPTEDPFSASPVDEDNPFDETYLPNKVLLSFPEQALAYAPTTDRIEQILAQSLSIRWRECELSQALDQFADVLGIELYTDAVGLEEAGITLDQRVNLELHHLPAKFALQHLLGPLNLCYFVREGAMIVTSREMCLENLQTRVYDVGDLVHPEFIAIDPRDAPQLFQREAHARKEYIAEEERLDYDALIEVIMGTIEPDSWMDSGGRSTLSEFPAKRRLIVSQTADFHQQIEQLLSTLRAVAAGNVLSMHIDRHFPRHAEIHRRLQQEISVNWYDLSLQRVAQQLGERLDINVLFDPVGLEEAAVSTSDRVTGNLSQGRASTLLRAALPANLDYIVKDGVVLITSREGMQENLETRVYNVRDLVRIDERGVGGKKGKPKPMLNPWTGEMISSREDYDTLMEVLESNVNPDSWMNNGGKGTVMGFHGMLAVAQTASTHQEIRQMFAALRKPASPLRADYRLYREELWIEQDRIQREFMQSQEAEQPPEEEQATPAEQQGGGGGFF